MRRMIPLAAALVAAALLLAACGHSGRSAGGAEPTLSASDVTAFLDAGLHEQAIGNVTKADADYLSVVKADPSNTLAWYDLGVIAQERSYATQAIGDYERALKANPRYEPALYNLAILETASAPKLAVSLYERCIAFKPDAAPCYLNLGFVERRLGDTAAGSRDIAKAVALDPKLSPTSKG